MLFILSQPQNIKEKIQKTLIYFLFEKVIILEAKYKIIKEHGNGKYQIFTKELDLVKLKFCSIVFWIRHLHLNIQNPVVNVCNTENL